MKKVFVKKATLAALVVAALAFTAGCSTSTESDNQVDEVPKNGQETVVTPSGEEGTATTPSGSETAENSGTSENAGENSESTGGESSSTGGSSEGQNSTGENSESNGESTGTAGESSGGENENSLENQGESDESQESSTKINIFFRNSTSTAYTLSYRCDNSTSWGEAEDFSTSSNSSDFIYDYECAEARIQLESTDGTESYIFNLKELNWAAFDSSKKYEVQITKTGNPIVYTLYEVDDLNNLKTVTNPATYTVTLDSFDAAKKIPVIKATREITGLGLGEAKALVEGAPKVVKENLTYYDALKAVNKLNEDGGTASMTETTAVENTEGQTSSSGDNGKHEDDEDVQNVWTTVEYPEDFDPEE